MTAPAWRFPKSEMPPDVRRAVTSYRRHHRDECAFMTPAQTAIKRVNRCPICGRTVRYVGVHLGLSLRHEWHCKTHGLLYEWENLEVS